jgi:hypothetical protein
MLFIGLSDTIECVCAEDAHVTPHEGVTAGWFKRYDPRADISKAAHRFKVRPLNGRELARVYNATNLERLYAAAEIAVVDISPPVTDQMGERLTIRDAVGHLGFEAVSGLFAIIDAMTHGQDPFAVDEIVVNVKKEGAADSVAPKSN